MGQRHKQENVSRLRRDVFVPEKKPLTVNGRKSTLSGTALTAVFSDSPAVSVSPRSTLVRAVGELGWRLMSWFGDVFSNLGETVPSRNAVVHTSSTPAEASIRRCLTGLGMALKGVEASLRWRLNNFSQLSEPSAAPARTWPAK